jgi:hypothetical protein
MEQIKGTAELRNGHLESFYHSKKLAKLTEGKIVTSFFGTFRGGFEPEMQLFGWVLEIK